MILDLLKSFVEGRVGLDKIQSVILKDQDAEDFLRNSPSIPPYTGASSDGYEYIIALDDQNNDDMLDAQDFLGQVLEKSGILYVEAGKYKKLAAVKLKSQPKWVDVDQGIFSEIIDAAEKAGFSGKALVTFVKDEINKRYLFDDKPPVWLQNPSWPVIGGVPLKFIGQEKNNSKHDESYDYKFCDQKSGEITVVTQTA